MIVGQIGAGRSIDEMLADYPYLVNQTGRVRFEFIETPQSASTNDSSRMHARNPLPEPLSEEWHVGNF